jgi:hypothetical protein
VALRPVEILSRDYAEIEYGIKPAEREIIARKLQAKAKKARASEKAKVFNTGLEALLEDSD